MRRSGRSISKEYVQSVLEDSGISVSSPPAISSNLEEDLPKTEEYDIKVNDQLENTNKHISKTENDEGSGGPAKRKRTVHKCSVCEKIFGGKTDLKRHELIHSNKRPYQCTQCEKSYRQAVNLKNHITTAHERQKSFKCEQCLQRFGLKERLRLHMRLHSGEKPYACKLCDKSFPRGGQLQQHIASHHRDSSKQHVCTKCSAAFSTISNLRAHMLYHEEGREYHCEICNENFLNEVWLRAHIKKVHLKMRPMDCDVCKETINDNDFVAHMKTHAHLKTYVCDVCNACYTKKSQYNVHMRMHSGERPYQCRICWQTFAHSSVLKLHIRKHTGEKPFSCVLCCDEVAFSQLAHLKTHMRKIHQQENAYICNGCQIFFKTKNILLTHIDDCVAFKQQIDMDRGDLSEKSAIKENEVQTLSHLRFLIAIMLKKISSEQKLQQLGYEKRLIDNVMIASLKLANRKAHDDVKLSAIQRLRLNISEFLNWIVPAPVMIKFYEEKLSVDNILEKIVAMYMKQK